MFSRWHYCGLVVFLGGFIELLVWGWVGRGRGGVCVVGGWLGVGKG